MSSRPVLTQHFTQRATKLQTPYDAMFEPTTSDFCLSALPSTTAPSRRASQRTVVVSSPVSPDFQEIWKHSWSSSISSADPGDVNHLKWAYHRPGRIPGRKVTLRRLKSCIWTSLALCRFVPLYPQKQVFPSLMARVWSRTLGQDLADTTLWAASSCSRLVALVQKCPALSSSIFGHCHEAEDC